MKIPENKIHVGLVGTGGFAREVMPLLKEKYNAGNEVQLDVYYIDIEASSPINGVPVISEKEFLEFEGKKLFNIAIADSRLREKIAERYKSNGCEPLDISATNAIQVGINEIGEGSIICPFSCITADSRIGNYFHCNIYSYIAHDCIIGDFVTFAPNVHCNGNVVIEDHAYVGTGAILKQGSPDRPLRIGKGAVIGMGAVVTKDVPPGVVVVGNPAKPLMK